MQYLCGVLLILNYSSVLTVLGFKKFDKEDAVTC